MSHRKQTEHTNTIMREKNRLDMRTTECFMMLRARHFALNMNIVRKERKSERANMNIFIIYSLRHTANLTYIHVTFGWQTTKNANWHLATRAKLQKLYWDMILSEEAQGYNQWIIE